MNTFRSSQCSLESFWRWLIVIVIVSSAMLGPTSTVYAQPNTGSISGVVRDDNNIPITSISIPVSLVSINGSFVDGTCSDPNTGNYIITDIPLDSYMVAAGEVGINCGSEYSYAREYWQETPFANTFTPVVLKSSRSSATNIDFTLQPGGTITGTVRDINGAPITGGRISVALNLASQPNVPTEIYTCSDASTGQYKLEHIPLGFDYTVSAVVFPCPDGLDSSFLTSWWQNSSTQANAIPISLNDNSSTITNIDFTLSPIAIERTAPYDFITEINGLVNCNFTSINGTGEAKVESNFITGNLLLDLRARSFSGKSEGVAGVGIKHIAPLNGTIKIDADVSVSGFDSLSLLNIEKIGDTGIASVQSGVEIFVTRIGPRRDAQNTANFASRIMSPNLLPIPNNPVDLVTYRPPQPFSGSIEIDVNAGDQLFICAGVRSKVVATGLVPWLATAKVLYGQTNSGNTKVDLIRISYK